MKIHHIGWNTEHPELFEKFWVDFMGFELVFTSTLSAEKAAELFSIEWISDEFESPGPAEIRRYEHPKEELPAVEIHVWKGGTEGLEYFPYNVNGISHICLMVSDRFMLADRAALHGLEVRRFTNHEEFESMEGTAMRSWENIFIRDYEGNWIELRS